MTEELTPVSTSLLTEDIVNNVPCYNNHKALSDKEMSDSDEENKVFRRPRNIMKPFNDSDSGSDKEVDEPNKISPVQCDSDSNRNEKTSISKKKFRIKNVSNIDSDSDSQEDNNDKELKKYDLSRTKIKSKKLQDKFKQLKNSTRNVLKESIHDGSGTSDDGSVSSDSDNSSIGSSCLKIKEKCNKKKHSTLSSTCDPDTSDEEHNGSLRPHKSRTIKLTSPKPVRMSAKQAMENMQKIKSESNRMLREKVVSLPYHRPKGLNLKDIMSRRRPAVNSDGKSLPIKMNNEQLKQYVLLLEQRQKEMMELCKSDTEEEEEDCPEQAAQNDLTISGTVKEGLGCEIKLTKQDCEGLGDINDKIFDDINMEQKTDDNKTNNVDENIVINPGLSVIKELISKNDIELGNCVNDNAITDNLVESEEIPSMEIDSVPQNLPLCMVTKEQESQKMYLHYDSEKTEVLDVENKNEESLERGVLPKNKDKENISDEFSDNELTNEELDRIVENVEINKDIPHEPLAHNEAKMEIKPKLTGAPGMFIDLDDDDSSTQKLTGVELLKERFTFFAKLKSLEDMEKDREKKFKPGTQHLKLKQELEKQIAEHRFMEWEKRLEEENKLKAEINSLNADQFDGEDIEKIEAKLNEKEILNEHEESSSEEEVEDDIDMRDKPRKRNPMIDDEAEISDSETIENTKFSACKGLTADDNDGNIVDDNLSNNSDSEEDDDDDDSSESEQADENMKPRKSRILKAFEDSDDEDSKVNTTLNVTSQPGDQNISISQDDEIPSAQLHNSNSYDLLTSQECSQKSIIITEKHKNSETSFDHDLGSQTFSITKSVNESIIPSINVTSEKLDVISETQPYSDDNFDAIVGMCTGEFVQNLVTPEVPTSQLSQSQAIGDDIADLCTGKFYDNPLVSQSELENEGTVENEMADDSLKDTGTEIRTDETNYSEEPNEVVNPKKGTEGEDRLLKSILEELDDPKLDTPRPNKYFFNDNNKQDMKEYQNVDNTQLKKKFVIESDDEMNGFTEDISKKKKRKKRKLQDRALQFSDDEDSYSEQEEATYESDIEDNNIDDTNRLVEYDSEENEVEILAKAPKKKRMGKEFFEQEAELTSEDEWIGSGDEDEAGLDRMEREAGDDDTFNQGTLQRELGEIHMREVLDQDKREVRLLQELLFEDGDLGDGHRQRKFRWNNADGEEELGTNVNEYADTQEDEFESEEQWRKQRHEREMFLRNLHEKGEEDVNISVNRNALIKANLSSKTLLRVTEKIVNTIEKPKPEETRAASDIPSPKKLFTIFQQKYHNSLLTRGHGTLARLAALATPLALDGDDAPKVNTSSNRGNFVFAAITPDDTEPKATKRKAPANPETPRLLKKMKQDLNKYSKSSLLDHL